MFSLEKNYLRISLVTPSYLALVMYDKTPYCTNMNVFSMNKVLFKPKNTSFFAKKYMELTVQKLHTFSAKL